MASTRATAANAARKASFKATKAFKVAKSKATKAPAPRNAPRTVRAPVVAAPITAPVIAAVSRRRAPVITPSVDSEPEPEVSSDDEVVPAQPINSHDRDELAHFRSRAHKHRVRKARARKAKSHKEHRRHYISDSSTSSTASSSESDDSVRRPIVSFVDNAGKKPFLSLPEEFRAVNVKYFKQIYQGTFAPRHLTKLGNLYTDGMANLDKKDKKHEDIQEASGLCQLLRCFEVYGVAICHFAAPGIVVQLGKALALYRIRISDFSVHYRFDSIRSYHYSFMTARIYSGQDDPFAWSKEDQGCLNLLVRKTVNEKPFTSTAGKSAAGISSSARSCYNFNSSRPCAREPCPYQHTCGLCGQGHPALTCSKAPPASNSNSTALGPRITKSN